MQFVKKEMTMKYGYFDNDNREYVITQTGPPVPSQGAATPTSASTHSLATSLNMRNRRTVDSSCLLEMLARRELP